MSNTITVDFSANRSAGDYTINYLSIDIRDGDVVVFDLTSVDEENDPVIVVEGVFGDGSTYSSSLNVNVSLVNYDIIKVANTGKVYSTPQTFSHEYQKTGNTYSDSITASFALTYTSNRKGIFNIPINLLQSSYYDSIQYIHYNTTQIVPVSTNDIFAVATTKDGSAFNMLLSRTQFPPITSAETVTQNITAIGVKTLSNFLIAPKQGGVIVPQPTT